MNDDTPHAAAGSPYGDRLQRMGLRRRESLTYATAESGFVAGGCLTTATPESGLVAGDCLTMATAESTLLRNVLDHEDGRDAEGVRNARSTWIAPGLFDRLPALPLAMNGVLALMTAALVFASGCASSGGFPERTPPEPFVEQQSAGTDELLIGLDVVSERTVWAAGAGGSYTWTDDGGESWHADTVPGADSLQFRDVHAVSGDVVYLLSIGYGRASRIYLTTDRGASWSMVFVNEVDEAFFDCFDFWDDGAGLAFSDAVDGRFPLARSTDGRTWGLVPQPDRPGARAGEGGFAASGTCLITLGDGTALIGTGNAPTARVLRTSDRGESWTSSEVPIVSGEAAGITTLAFRNEDHGAALGGLLTESDGAQANAAVTDDGGRTWRPAASPTFSGAVYGSTYVPGTETLVAVGPGGAAYSLDDAGTWEALDTLSYWSVDAAGPSAVWAVGPEGRVARIDFRP